MADSEAPKQSPWTHQDRIRELASIESDVTKAVASAGSSLQVLTGRSDDQQLSPEEIRDKFEGSTRDFMNAIQAVGARLRRQVYALEEAGIIPPTREEERIESTTATASTNPMDQLAGAKKVNAVMNVTNAGMGKFDVGTLNSKRDDVGRIKEAELWREARDLLKELQQEDTGDQSMEVDR